jgi:EAL domain-containing protein (putative c-di-GMP-specific phosphodiesterase class I)
MTIVAEGVESFEEVAYLQAATSIRFAQGFYFSEPLYLEDMIRKDSPERGLAEEGQSRVTIRSPERA